MSQYFGSNSNHYSLGLADPGISVKDRDGMVVSTGRIPAIGICSQWVQDVQYTDDGKLVIPLIKPE